MSRTNTSPARTKTLLALILLTLFGMLVGIWLAKDFGDNDVTDAARSRVLENPKSLGKFTLTTHTLSPLTPSSLHGKWSFVFFGYTYCPDICPSTLAELARTFKQGIHAYPELSDTQAIFISVDPERDTPERLAAYVKYFDPTFIGATGTHEQLTTLTQQLGIKYGRGPQTSDGYAVNHTSAVLLIDPQGRYFAHFIPPHYAQEVFQEYLNIRNYYQNSQ